MARAFRFALASIEIELDVLDLQHSIAYLERHGQVADQYDQQTHFPFPGLLNLPDPAIRRLTRNCWRVLQDGGTCMIRGDKTRGNFYKNVASSKSRS